MAQCMTIKQNGERCNGPAGNDSYCSAHTWHGFDRERLLWERHHKERVLAEHPRVKVETP